MGHQISGIVAHRETLAALEAPFDGQPAFALTGDFAFLPLDDENLDAVVGLNAGPVVGGFRYLTARLIEALRAASRHGDLAYVETEYFGGVGGQGAIAFAGQKIAFGPAFADGHAINDALAILGVKSGTAHRDAFSAIGLDRYRANDRFAGRL